MLKKLSPLLFAAAAVTAITPAIARQETIGGRFIISDNSRFVLDLETGLFLYPYQARPNDPLQDALDIRTWGEFNAEIGGPELGGAYLIEGDPASIYYPDLDGRQECGFYDPQPYPTADDPQLMVFYAVPADACP